MMTPTSGRVTGEASNLTSWSEEQRASFGRRPMVLGHQLMRHAALFGDEALEDLLDRAPSDSLFALAMGVDPERASENERVSTRGVSGNALLRAVRNGRLWLNLPRIDTWEPRFRAMAHRLHGEVARQVPAFHPIQTHATLLISSPTAQVYYHVDGPPSLLWHIRGRKRVWVYPALDRELVGQELLEEIFAGAAHEYVPYRRAFDRRAVTFDLGPGDVASWPQNAPHRVCNLEGLNISLNTEFYTRQSRQRARVYCANRALRRLRLPIRSSRETGAVALIKVAAHQALRALGLAALETKRHPAEHRRVDPDAPFGVTDLVR